MLDKLQIILMEANIPHLNQSAYCKKVSCHDATFATQEAICKIYETGQPGFYVPV